MKQNLKQIQEKKSELEKFLVSYSDIITKQSKCYGIVKREILNCEIEINKNTIFETI